MNVLVTGGTGTSGRVLASRLREAGHRVRILSRQSGSGEDWCQGDLSPGAGLADAVREIETIVHAGSATKNFLKANQTDVRGTRRLLEYASAAGILHFVYVSIVGIDNLKSTPYYRQKLAAEEVVRENMVPWSIQRATQFHPLVDSMMGGFASFPFLMAVPFHWQVQPVDPIDVASRLVQIVNGSAGCRLPDFGGPEVRSFRSLAAPWLMARHREKHLVNLALPEALSRPFLNGHLLTPEHKEAAITWETYLQNTQVGKQ